MPLLRVSYKRQLLIPKIRYSIFFSTLRTELKTPRNSQTSQVRTSPEKNKTKNNTEYRKHFRCPTSCRPSFHHPGGKHQTDVSTSRSSQFWAAFAVSKSNYYHLKMSLQNTRENGYITHAYNSNTYPASHQGHGVPLDCCVSICTMFVAHLEEAFITEARISSGKCMLPLCSAILTLIQMFSFLYARQLELNKIKLRH